MRPACMLEFRHARSDRRRATTSTAAPQPPRSYTKMISFLVESVKNDLTKTATLWRIWLFLGWEEIARQYRRSFLGPIWLTLNTGIFIFSFGYIWANLFGQQLSDYLPYITAGQLIFTFLNSCVVESCTVFISNEAFIKQIPTPKLGFVVKLIVKNLITLAHNLIVLIIVYAWFDKNPGWTVLHSLPGLLISVINIFLLSNTLGVICTRFRDVPMIIINAMQVLFFITPVMWKPSQLSAEAQAVVEYNPMAVFLQLVRDPILGMQCDPYLWKFAAVFTVVNAVLFIVVFGRFRSRIVFWL